MRRWVMSNNSKRAAEFFAGRSSHSLPSNNFISDGEVREGNTCAGYGYAEFLAARGFADTQEARRAWRAGK